MGRAKREREREREMKEGRKEGVKEGEKRMDGRVRSRGERQIEEKDQTHTSSMSSQGSPWSGWQAGDIVLSGHKAFMA